MTRSRRGAAFTLVELMMVVVILGVLASLAIYGVARYLKHSKTAEALRKAQEFIRSQGKWKHPYYWAAWVLWGLPS